jgi:hypothetical protein
MCGNADKCLVVKLHIGKGKQKADVRILVLLSVSEALGM